MHIYIYIHIGIKQISGFAPCEGQRGRGPPEPGEVAGRARAAPEVAAYNNDDHNHDNIIVIIMIITLIIVMIRLVTLK